MTVSNTSNMTTPFIDLITTTYFNDSNTTYLDKHFCYKVLYWDLPNSKIKLWDMLILVPNVIFFSYLLLKLSSVLTTLKRFNRYIFTVLFALVFISQSLGIARCVVSMTVHNDIYSIADRVMWLILKFFLLASELSVLTFGILFGHLDSKSSIQRVLTVTFLASLIYSSTQGVLEFLHKNDSFHFIHDGSSDYTLFGHGGMIFWFTSSFILSMIYATICLLPSTNLIPPSTLPKKKSFYVYCGILSTLNCLQGVGSVMLYVGVVPGFCILDLTTYLYFTCFAPLIYLVFLYSFMNSKRFPSLLFSYRHQSEYSDNYENNSEDDDLLVPSPFGATPEPLDNLDTYFDEVINSQLSSYSRNGGGGGGGGGGGRYSNLDRGVLTFDNPSNPFCPSLTNHPDLTLQTPRVISPPPPPLHLRNTDKEDNVLVDFS